MLLYFLGTVLLVRIITKYFPFQSQDYQFNNVKKSAFCSILIITAELMITLAYLIIIDNYFGKISKYILLLRSCTCVLFTVIVLLVVLHEKESLQSIGITKENLLKSVILGVILGALFFTFYNIALANNKPINILTAASLNSFISFLFVGFEEEIVFRGYFQIRLISWLGTTKGLLITAIIFSFYHLPVNVFFKGMELQPALISCASIIPLSLMFGYIMIKTKNIAGVAILHTVIDWTIH